MVRSINRCLNDQLRGICQRIIQLDELNHKIKALLSSPLRDNCQVGSFNKGCLLLTTSNTWATELRYSLPDLRDKLRKAGLYQLTAIKIAIIDNDQSIACEKDKKILLSSSAKDSIRTASELCSYPPLKAALYHLADEKR
ncbi:MULTISPECIES: DUF721 domain-containing protein [Legionella]|uniref:DUF721 domain-containing protein n=1 Tax=Legionella maceachernii TaxID=466 RepID=A0A0W0W7V4_9GAMM|nr:DUF721 domain-containing protein [Legionella maceachernii]KTD28006.1 hypothetical protein Lmac_1065 [Legionella maceachernii]SKA06672.1 Protein of unknown function [Legionella maceachernii]SUO99876.1 Protein of uncharacterised function (DUF721) [Legionella maceachernii]